MAVPASLLGAMLVALPLATLLAADAVPHNKLDRSRLEKVFDEGFDRPPIFWDRERNPGGRWKTNYFFGVQDAGHDQGWTSRTLETNGELQYYAPPKSDPAVFEWQAGILSLVARPNPGHGEAGMHSLPYLSGLITTERSFSMAEGYFEARIALPEGRGLWPAFWLLPEPRIENGEAVNPGGQEVDVMESIGEPGIIYQTAFNDLDGPKSKSSHSFAVKADLTDFHDYGVLVTKSEIVWYFDDVEIWRAPNRDFHRPAYMLLNLAVGGNWAGPPQADVRFPAALKIDWVRAHRLRRGR